MNSNFGGQNLDDTNEFFDPNNIIQNTNSYRTLDGQNLQNPSTTQRQQNGRDPYYFVPPQQNTFPTTKRKFTPEEIKLVQNLIERCLRLYMSQNEAITALHVYQNIEPGFISLVWQKLEEQNPEFFKAYNIRLKIKEQISSFNFLVNQQAYLMQKKGVVVNSNNPQNTSTNTSTQKSTYTQYANTFGHQQSSSTLDQLSQSQYSGIIPQMYQTQVNSSISGNLHDQLGNPQINIQTNLSTNLSTNLATNLGPQSNTQIHTRNISTTRPTHHHSIPQVVNMRNIQQFTVQQNSYTVNTVTNQSIPLANQPQQIPQQFVQQSMTGWNGIPQTQTTQQVPQTNSFVFHAPQTPTQYQTKTLQINQTLQSGITPVVQQPTTQVQQNTVNTTTLSSSVSSVVSQSTPDKPPPTAGLFDFDTSSTYGLLDEDNILESETAKYFAGL